LPILLLMQTSLYLEQFVFYAGAFALSCLQLCSNRTCFVLYVTGCVSRIHALYSGGPDSVLVLRPIK